MFEHRQDKMDSMMKESEDFRRIYNRHQELDKRVTAAELGTAPMDDLALNQQLTRPFFLPGAFSSCKFMTQFST